MQQYRIKKSPAVIVQAAQLTADNVDELANWAQAQVVEEGRDKESKQEALNIKTPNGKERLHQGMYLMKVGSDFYTVAAVNFEQRYELIPVVDAPLGGQQANLDNPWDGIPRIKDVP